MDYRQLLKKYIKHVGEAEGSTSLGDHDRSAWADMPEFTDEEWAKLQELEAESLAISSVTHSCSCHVKNQGPCVICKEIGCEVWDFNQVATLPDDRQPRFDVGVDRGSIFIIEKGRVTGVSLDLHPNAFGFGIEQPKPEKRRQEVMDMRKPGEAFCSDCPDHEGCMQGVPCSLAKRVNK